MSTFAAHDYRNEIETMMERFMNAMASKDAGAIAGFYADDATMLAPRQPPIRGRDNIRQHWQRLLEAGARATSMKIQSIEGSGDLAYEVGEWIGVAPSPGGGLVEVTAKYVSVWRWEEGGLKLVVDMFSANA
jgi:uncharacterized protein (TIGR02246 family)